MKKISFICFFNILFISAFAQGEGDYIPETIDITYLVRDNSDGAETVYFTLEKKYVGANTVTYDISGFYVYMVLGVMRSPSVSLSGDIYLGPQLSYPKTITLPINSPKPYFEFDFQLIYSPENIQKFTARSYDIPLPGPARL
ncbi:hypothetical protein FUAX_52930 (plasmid) [Fulvitalea axinellae]|uniref:Uncharacterized protein n=1 Tax=Fulvitalea axinellae TaxID=1182444 RepID=A0AAU9CLI1_9BACT|nr:hypothetical protein FUAX_52930 [Fulvitalea axinellae]